MKKILYVTTISRTINAFLVPHIEMLIKKGNKVDIACNIDVDLDSRLLKREINVYNILFSRNPLDIKNVKAYRKIKKLVRNNEYNLVHVHTPVASFITRYALKNESVEVIYTAHGFHFYNGASIINWMVYYPLERIAARWTDKLILINSEDLNAAKKFKLRSNRKPYLMHGVGVVRENYNIENFIADNYRDKLNFKDDDFIVLVSAELNKNKNHIQIIEAIRLLVNKYDNIKVICAGEGPLENYLKTKVAKYGLINNIVFLGFRNDIVAINKICDCVGLFSKREGLGKCLLEGMIAEKPLIATNTRGPRELIENNKNGFLIPFGNFKETAVAIEKLYLDKELRNKFSSYGIEKVKKYFLGNVLDELIKIYGIEN